MSIYQVTWKQRWLQQECRNIFYYETIDGDPATAEWQDIVDEIRGDMVAAGATLWVPEWEFYAIDYRKVDVAGLLSFEAIPTAGVFPGTRVSDSVPTQVAMLVSVKGVTTKPNRARSYMAGLAENQVVDSIWEAGTRASFEELIDLQTVLNAAGVNELQRVSAQWNTSHTMVTVTNNIAGRPAVASPVPATQRRRRIGVGI